MLTIIAPPDATTATVTESGDYVTLAHAGATLTVPTLARPGNSADVIYLGDDGALQYMPGTVPTIVAVLSCSQQQVSLTLYPLQTSTPATPTTPA